MFKIIISIAITLQCNLPQQNNTQVQTEIVKPTPTPQVVMHDGKEFTYKDGVGAYLEKSE